MENPDLLVNFVVALGAGLVGALIAARLHQSVILGYIVAGIVIGPFTPGFVAAEGTVHALADIGIILLMFAIGVELSLAELLRSGKVATLGAAIQLAALIGIGFGIGIAVGWEPLESLFVGAVVSISSSTVLVKIAGDAGEIESPHSRLTLAWSTVQDFATVILIVVLSALATDSDSLALDVTWEVAKAGLFLILLVPLGLRVLPWLFDWIAALRSREVFVLSVGVAALGLAYSATFFGLSLALGAFVAGIVVGESDLSHQILGEILPLRDIFAGLFFVSVGMLVDPGFVARNIPLLLLTVVVIIVVKGVISALIAARMKTPLRTAVLTGALLAVSAEFSFLLARLGRDADAVGTSVFNLMLAGSAVSIMLAPAIYRGAKPIAAALEARHPPEGSGQLVLPDHLPESALRGHAVICGYGAVGQVIGDLLTRHGFRFVVIDENPRVAHRLRKEGIPIVQGNASIRAVLEAAKPGRARVIVAAIPDPVATRILIDYLRDEYPRLDVVVRTHSDEERRELLERGVKEVVFGEWELALEMARHTLHRFGLEALLTQQVIQHMRGQIEIDPDHPAVADPPRDRRSLESELRRFTRDRAELSAARKVRRGRQREDSGRDRSALPSSTGSAPGEADREVTPTATRPVRKPRIKNVR